MKIWLSLVVGIVALIALMHILSSVIGLLFSAGITVVILACVIGLIRNAMAERRALTPPGRREQRRMDKATDQALKDLERKVNKQ